MKIILTLSTLLLLNFSHGQVITSSPQFPTSEDEVVITFHANEGNGGLSGYTGDVYAHTGVLTSNSSDNSDWKYVIAQWEENIDKAKLTRVSDDTYELTITGSVRSFYEVPENEEITHLAFVFRAEDRSREGKEADGSDIFLEISNSGSSVIASVPENPSHLDEVVLTFNAQEGNGELAGYTGDVYAHTGVLTDQSNSNSEWKYVLADWGTNIEKAKLTRVSDDVYEFAISPDIRSFYGVPDGEIITSLAFVFRASDGSLVGRASGGGDIFLNVIDDSYQMNLSNPANEFVFVSQGDSILIQASSSKPSTYELTVDGMVVNTQESSTSYSFYQTVDQNANDTIEVSLKAISIDDEVVTRSFNYLIPEVISEALPNGLRPGINYSSDDTRVTLVLHAPGKSTVNVVGEFNDWQYSTEYTMKKDGDFFWIEITGLTPMEEYAFQYLVDGHIYLADLYTDKILHPDDQYINSAIYPNLKSYPTAAMHDNSFYRTVSVLQTGQEAYQWGDQDFVPHDQTELIVYELLIRDFFNNGEETYANLTDTLSYLKSMGINAIELMPVNEFAGNDSWGYNPTFMFAPDKAYGPKNELKRFIDTAHQMGFSVILDMVLNHQDLPNPLLLLDFNFNTFRPTDENIYFNNDGAGENGAKHDFSVFYDFDHTQPLTQAYVDSVNHYWIEEYHFDGYRFDLTKGFQQNGPQDGYAYNAERIGLLKRMADDIWSHSPNAYVILEHFTDNQEEKELSNHGMMIWANMHWNYKQLVLGYSENSDISWAYHANRGWNDAHAVGYMESHDEQRLMYEAIEFGNATDDYSIKDPENAIDRIAAASALLYLIPGPKMIWQFGEYAYDIDLNFNGRTGQKPVPWNNAEGLDYNHEESRVNLRQYISEILKLKTAYSIFNTGVASISEGSNLNKEIVLLNPANTTSPTSADEMNAVVIANFNTVADTLSPNFPHDGPWYSYFHGNAISSSSEIPLASGDYLILTDYPLERPDVPLSVNDQLAQRKVEIFPNPTNSQISILSDEEVVYYFIFDLKGAVMKKGKYNGNFITIENLPKGIYLLETISRKGLSNFNRIIKQ